MLPSTLGIVLGHLFLTLSLGGFSPKLLILPSRELPLEKITASFHGSKPERRCLGLTTLNP